MTMLFVLQLWLCYLLPCVLALWPQPQYFKHGSATLWLPSNLSDIALVIEQDKPVGSAAWNVWKKAQEVLRYDEAKAIFGSLSFVVAFGP